MKTKLRELTLSEFIELSCGDLSVLGGKPGEESVKAAKAILYEYKGIINSSQVKSEIYRSKSLGNKKARVMLYRICISLLAIGEHEHVKSILSEIGWTAPDDAERLRVKLDNEAKRIQFAIDREASEEVPEESMTADEIRSQFDRQIASVMTYFKMAVDPNTVSASVFANIVKQAMDSIEEQRRVLAKMKR